MQARATIQDNDFLFHLKRDDWSRRQEIEFVERSDRPSDRFDESGRPEHCLIDSVWGVGRKISRAGSLSIVFTETYSYDVNEPESFSASPEGLNDWLVVYYDDEPVDVVDSKGCPLTMSEINFYLPESMLSIDYSEVEICEEG